MGIQLIQVKKYDSSRELRDAIIKALDKDSHKLFYLTLYRKGEGENRYSEPDSFVIQYNTCETMETMNAFSLAFDKNAFIRACVGRDRWKTLENKIEGVRSSLKKITNVLGDVPAAEELKSNVNKLLQAMQDCLECDDVEDTELNTK